MTPHFHVVGFHRQGKTTWCEALLEEAHRRALSLIYVKHHHVTPSPKTKDTGRLLGRGAQGSLLVEGERLLWEQPTTFSLSEVLALASGRSDAILVEGWKGDPGPKLWVGRMEGDLPAGVVATAQCTVPGLPCYGLDQAGVAQALTQLLTAGGWRHG